MFVYTRESWLPCKHKIVLPVDRNIIDLKNEWSIICINVSFHIPSDRQKVIKPSCLRVDMATSFFKSVSTVAIKPDTSMVATPKMIINHVC